MMSWMIVDRNALQGTCYMEVLPGRYAGKCWNDRSVFFEEIPFGYLERIIERNWPSYDHYAFNEINSHVWRKIVADMQAVGRAIEGGATVKNLDGHIGFFSTSRDFFMEQERVNLEILRQTIVEFTDWLMQRMETSEAISVLGM